MTPMFAGLWCLFAAPIVDEPARIDEIVALLTDPRWPWQPQLLHAGSIPGGPRTPQVKGKIRREKLAGAIHAALTASSTSRIDLMCSRLNDSNRASIVIDSGRFMPGKKRVPFELLAWIHIDQLPAATSAGSWLALCHDLVRAVRGVHAVIPVMHNRFAMSDELYLSTTTVNGRLQHPGAMEIQRVARHRYDLGARYVRPPRWGTYLGPDAVAAAGGRDRIAAVVQPAVLADVGPLLYIQLSAAFEDARTPATEAKRRELAKLLAPVMVPSP